MNKILIPFREPREFFNLWKSLQMAARPNPTKRSYALSELITYHLHEFWSWGLHPKIENSHQNLEFAVSKCLEMMLSARSPCHRLITSARHILSFGHIQAREIFSVNVEVLLSNSTHSPAKISFYIAWSLSMILSRPRLIEISMFSRHNS